MRLLILFSLLMSAAAPASAPALTVTCQSVTVYYQAPGFSPRMFTARAVVNNTSLPLAYSGIDGKGYHTWTARVNGGDLRAQGYLQHVRLDYVMQTQQVKIRCARAFERRR